MTDQKQTEAAPDPKDRVITQAESIQAASELQAFKALEGRNSKKKRAQRLRLAIGIVGGTLVLFLAFILLRNYFSPVPDNPVQTDVVARGTYTDSIQASGNLAAYEQVTITPEVDGTIAELYISEGDTVEKGQLLFTIDNPSLDQAVATAQRGVDSANLQLRGAEAAVNDAKNAVDIANRQYEETKKAYEESLLVSPDAPNNDKTPDDPDNDDINPMPDVVITENDVYQAYQAYLAAVSAHEGAKLSLEGAQMGVSSAKVALDDAVAYADKRNVYAPITGQVILMNLERGMKLSTLLATGQLVAQIADVSKMRLRVEINEIDILAVETGMRSIVNVSALPGYVADAQVLRVASTSTSASDAYYYGSGGLVTYIVDLLIDDPDPRLKIGMSADARIITLSYENVLLVNSMAVQNAGDINYVQVMDADGNIRQVSVKVIASNYSVTVVEGDINVGDTVIVTYFSGTGGNSGGSTVSPGIR
ncbi:MAG: efflux RND transporter periplasmic adaptor subunit [Coriobacteriia bacterium]|nr:efflux RND transporter periplasmic adaptor subunit [Coriobacteriia bacterium]